MKKCTHCRCYRVPLEDHRRTCQKCRTFQSEWQKRNRQYLNAWKRERYYDVNIGAEIKRGRPKKDPVERLRYVIAPDGCWNWSGCVGNQGYGQISVDGKQWRAHRLSFSLLVGPIPAGFQLDHLCRNRRCINPSHLQIVTTKQNVLRGRGLCAANSQKTHCPYGHPYDESNTVILKNYRDRSFQRACRICVNRRQRERYKRRMQKRYADLKGIAG